MRLYMVGLALLIMNISCKEKIFTGDVDCDECYTEEPRSADLIIDLTIDNRYPRVPVTIFRGDVEDNDIVVTDTVDFTPFYYLVKVDKKYSVRVEYKINDQVVYVIEGTHLKKLSVSDACEEQCYVIENDKMDARLNKGFPK